MVRVLFCFPKWGNIEISIFGVDAIICTGPKTVLPYDGFLQRSNGIPSWATTVEGATVGPAEAGKLLQRFDGLTKLFQKTRRRIDGSTKLFQKIRQRIKGFKICEPKTFEGWIK